MAELLQISNNYLTETDENGQRKVNATYYYNVINDSIQAYMEEHKLTKISGNDLLAIFNETRQRIFACDHNQPHNRKCNIPYTQYNISTLLQIYINLCMNYKCNPSLFGFSTLTGINEDAIKQYVTLAHSEILNIRREMLRNELYNDRMGRIVLANNDSSYGLEYEKKQAQERETIRQGLTLEDLQSM